MTNQIRKFPKNHRRIYRILDDEAYKRFWWGKKPSTKPIFEEWLVTPDETMHSVAMRHGKSPILLQVLSRALRREGIMDIMKH